MGRAEGTRASRQRRWGEQRWELAEAWPAEPMQVRQRDVAAKWPPHPWQELGLRPIRLGVMVAAAMTSTQAGADLGGVLLST